MLNYSLLATVVIAVAALGGLVLATSVQRDKLAPWVLSVAHALLGASGLVFLILVMVQGSAPQRVLVAFILLLAAALGGFFLASYHLRKQFPPRAAVFAHAGIAILGFLVLLTLVM